MQEKHLFEYAVIRVVPRVEREEFVNAGVILYCSSQKFLKVKYKVDDLRIKALCVDTNIEEIQAYIHALEKICIGGAAGGTIGALPVASRFRWLTATRSSVVQASKVHPGLCLDPDETLARLFTELVS
jgi:hypothetical protein